jgi:SAM-dependent MidA family methyltransferase
MNIVLQEGARAEINLQATQWIKEIAAVLKKGYLITIDYGGLSELYSYGRRDGTIVCYKKHRDKYKSV